MRGFRGTGNHDKLKPTVRGAKGRGDIPSGCWAATSPLQGVDDSGLREPGFPDNLGLGATRAGIYFGAKVHTDQGNGILTDVKANLPGIGKELVYLLGMAPLAPSPWLQRTYFRKRLDLWMQENNKTKQDFAEAVGLSSANSLKQYYSGKQVPGRELALRFAKELGCKINEMIGEPSGTSVDNHESKAFGDIMEVLGRNLSPEMQASLIQIAKAGQTERETISINSRKTLGQAIRNARLRMDPPMSVEALSRWLSEIRKPMGVLAVAQCDPIEIEAWERDEKVPVDPILMNLSRILRIPMPELTGYLNRSAEESDRSAESLGADRR